MQIANGIMLAVFLLSTAVQYNDPDWWLWMAYYLIAAGFVVQAQRGRYSPLAAIAGLLYLAGFAHYLPGWSIETVKLLGEPKMSTNDVEEAREGFGLLICAVWMFVLAAVWFRRRGKGDAAAVTAREE